MLQKHNIVYLLTNSGSKCKRQTYSFEILSKMDEHFESSYHAVLVLFQQQISFLHLRRHQLLVEVTLHSMTTTDMSQTEFHYTHDTPSGNLHDSKLACLTAAC